MNIRFNRDRRFLLSDKPGHRVARHLLIDILPTFLLLLIMALCMSAFARYAESNHFTPRTDTELTARHIGG